MRFIRLRRQRIHHFFNRSNFFFLLFQKGGPLSAVPMILAGGAAIMAVAGIVFFKEAATFTRLLGVVLALAGLFLLRASAGK